MSEYETALAKAMRYCSTKEVCTADMLKKMADWKIDESLSEKIIQTLIDEKFIDNKRFAIAFASDKFRFNYWGKIKIKHFLQNKKIPSADIQIALDNIDMQQYIQTARKLITAKFKSLKDDSLLKKKQKLYSFMANKGYEADIIFPLLDEFIK